jgi:hypothetical protein
LNYKQTTLSCEALFHRRLLLSKMILRNPKIQPHFTNILYDLWLR